MYVYTRMGSNKGKTPEHKQAKHTKPPHSLEWHNSTITIKPPIKPKSRPFTLNFGPQHPAAHGVLRVLSLEIHQQNVKIIVITPLKPTTCARHGAVIV